MAQPPESREVRPGKSYGPGPSHLAIHDTDREITGSTSWERSSSSWNTKAPAPKEAFYWAKRGDGRWQKKRKRTAEDWGGSW